MRQHLEVDASPVRSGPAKTASSLQKRPMVLLGVVETPPAGLRARQLFEEARVASVDHLRALERAIATVRDLADEIVCGGELYSPGLRELARNLTEDLFWKAKTLELLSQRQSDRPRAPA
jgi:hypothetical protein